MVGRKRLGKFRRSNVTVAEFCRRENVSQASFYYWSSRLRQSGGSEVTMEQTASDPVESRSHVEGTHDVVEIVVSDSIRVRLPTSQMGAVPDLIEQLHNAVDDDSMKNSRFHRITLGPSTTQS